MRTRDVLTIGSIDHTDVGPGNGDRLGVYLDSADRIAVVLDDGDRLGVYLVVCDVGQDRLGGCLVVLVAAALLVVTSVVPAVLWLELFDYGHSHGTVASY